MNAKDSVFANAADAISDFETIFDDEEDSIIEMVTGFGENGESLIGKDPEELTTDNDDNKVDMEDSSPKTAFDLEQDAESSGGIKESVDLDELFDSCSESDQLCPACGSNPCKCAPAPKAGKVEKSTDGTDLDDILCEPDEIDIKDFHNESTDLDDLFNVNDHQTDETNNKDILEEPDEDDFKDFHDEAADLDDLFNVNDPQTDETNNKDILEEPDEDDFKDFHNEGAELDRIFAEAEEIEAQSKHDEFAGSPEGADDEDELEKNAMKEFYELGHDYTSFFEQDEEDDVEDYAEDELIGAADQNVAAGNMDLDYEAGEDDLIIDDVISGKE